ncbi:MAG: tandem-95 repeat protein, partial [Magnetococcales bacterium]|nr:tandem-95 repeat protein [Magnetococcales bacterium]
MADWGGGLVTVPITVNLVNDLPLLTAGNAATFTENGLAQVVDGSVTVSDVDHANLSSATVRISGNYQGGADQLAFVDGNGISGSWDGASGVLTLSGVASVADYQAALRSLTFINSSEAPTAAVRTITFVANDGVNDSVAVSATINVVAVIDPPQITAGNGYAVAFSEGDAAPLINPAIVLADIDDGNLEGAVVQFTAGYQAVEDQLLFSDSNGITGAWNGLTGVLTLSGTASLANYQTALQSIVYQNNGGDQPTAGARTLSWTVNDGDSNSSAITSSLTVTAINDAPQLSSSGTLTYTEGDTAPLLDGTLSVSDGDNSTLTGAVLRFDSGFVFAEDALLYSNANGISGSWDALFGVLTLSGVASTAQYQAAIRSVQYTNQAGEMPTAGLRTLTMTVNDGALDSAPVNLSLNVLAIDDLPVMTAGNLLLVTEGDGSQVVDSTITLGDVDNTTLSGATVQMAAGYVPGEDRLSYSGGLTALWESASGTLSLAGVASLATYQAALQSITYLNQAGDQPTAGVRTVNWLINDGSADSLLVTSTIQVIAVNDLPLVTAGAALTYTEGDAATYLDGGVTVADVDNSSLQRARLLISSGYVGGEDQLTFANQAGISGSWDDSSGSLVLNLSGSALLADYQTLLRSIQYNNLAGDNPTAGLRTIQWLVDDGSDESVLASSSVTVVAVNDAPVVVAGGSVTYNENGAAQTPLSMLTLSDADTLFLSSATVQIFSGYVAEDQLNYVTANGITGTYNAGTLTLSGAASAAAYQAALRSITYSNGGGDAPTAGMRTLSIVVNDGAAFSATVTATVDVLASNDAPLWSVPGVQVLQEDVVRAIPGISLADADAGSQSLTVTLSVSEGTLQLAGSNGLTFLSGGDSQASMTVSGSLADLNAALNNLSYLGGPDSDIDDILLLQVSDQGHSGAGGVLSAIAMVPLDVLAINDPPLLDRNNGLTVNEAEQNFLIDGTLLHARDVEQGPGQLIFMVDTLPTQGTLRNNGVTLSVGSQFSQDDIDHLRLSYSHSGAETSSDSFSVSLSDGAGGGWPDTVVSITINPVNDNPILQQNSAATLDEGAALLIDNSRLQVSDVDNTIWELSYTISQLPSNGTLLIGGVAVALNGVFTQADIDAGLLRYQHDGSETLTDTFRFAVNDGAGGLIATNHFDFTIQPVNDAPLLLTNSGATLNEADSVLLTNTLLQVTDTDNTTLQLTYTLTASPDHGLLRLNGTDLAAGDHFTQEEIDGGLLRYQQDGSETTTDLFRFTVADGSGGIIGETAFNLTIAAINDAPAITAGGDRTYSEGDPVLAVDGTVTVQDADHATLQGATVRFASGYVSGEDQLDFASAYGISAVWNSAGGILTLTGVASLSDYQAALRAVTYSNLAADNPTAGDRSVAFSVDDGISSSAVVSSTLRVAAVNDAAVLTAGALLSYSENDPATVLDATITVQDADNATLNGAIFRISSGYVAGEDQLLFSNGAGISGVWDALDGSLTLSGTASVATYQAALRQVSYRNNDGDTPTAGWRTVTITVDDGTVQSALVSSTVQVTASNDAPQISAGGVLLYSENDAAQFIDTTITVSDVDSNQLSLATLTISSNHDVGNDRLHFSDTASIVSTWDALLGRLTLLGQASAAEYQDALRSVTFVNSSDNPLAADRTVLIQLNDGLNDSLLASSTVRLLAVNDVPQLAGLQAKSYSEGESPLTVADLLTVRDADNSQLQGATLTISSGLAVGEDRLLFSDGNGISGFWNGATGQLSLVGAASVADYQSALRAITYENQSVDNPTGGQRTLTLEVNDGTALSLASTMLLNVQAVNDAPELQLTAAVVLPGFSYSEGDGTVTFDGNLLLSDPDNSHLQHATVQIVSGYLLGEDQLSVAAPGSLSSQWDAQSGMLTLSGAATVAAYQAALRTITYRNNGGENPTAGNRSLSYVLYDGLDSAAAVTGTLQVVAVNDAPVLSGGTTLSYREGDGQQAIDGTVSVQDADSSLLAGAMVRLTSGYRNGEDQLQLTSGGGITTLWDAASGTLTLSGSASLAAYQAALAQVTYQNLAGDTPHSGNRTVEYWLNDGALDSQVVTGLIDVLAVNDRPTLTVLTASLVYSEGDGNPLLDNQLLVDDVDHSQLVGAVIAFHAGYHAGEDRLLFNDTATITGTWDAANGQLLLSGTASLSDYQDALRSVSYSNLAGDNPSGGLRELAYEVYDGSDSSLHATSSLTVVAINDQPLLSAGGTISYNEGDAATLVQAALTLSDPDSPLLDRAVVRLTGMLASDEESLSATASGGIGVSWDAALHTLTLSGQATVNDYQTVLRSVTYRHSNGNDPLAGNRTVETVVNDGADESASSSVTVAVTAVNDAPQWSLPAGQSGSEDVALAIAPITVTDVDAGSASLQVALSVAHGTLSLAPGNLTISGGGLNQSALVLSGTLTDLQLALATIIYQGSADYNGTDSLLLQISDQGNAGSGGVQVASGSVAITLAAVNDNPQFGVDVLLTAEDTPITINTALDLLANDSDVDGHSLSITFNSQPETGTLVDNGDGTWIYTPQLNMNGLVSFSCQVSDGQGGTADGLVSIVINPIPDILQANSDSVAATLEDTPTDSQSVLSNDRDPDYHPGLSDEGLNPLLNVIGFTPTAHGVAVYHGDGTFTYTPDADFYGSDALTYTLNAGDNRIDTGTLTFTVSAVNDPPVWQANTGVVVNEAAAVTLGSAALQVQDVEQTATQLRYTMNTIPTWGTLHNQGVLLGLGSTFTQDDVDQGRLLYSHDGSETVADAFTVTVDDGAGATLFPATIVLTVTPVNDTPLLPQNSGGSLLEGESLTISRTLLLVTDADNSTSQLQYTLGSVPGYGTLSRNGSTLVAGDHFTQADVDGTLLLYQHAGNEQFNDAFTFTVSDGAGGSITTQSFVLTITPVNDLPVLDNHLPLTLL